mmetsp:Transcript_3406/g.9807  ORF Transcript_3406/g.9807 Transcript_3406/m.9807 type:complete len:321 (-) Transcript_3406:169-1131(-)
MVLHGHELLPSRVVLELLELLLQQLLAHVLQLNLPLHRYAGKVAARTWHVRELHGVLGPLARGEAVRARLVQGAQGRRVVPRSRFERALSLLVQALGLAAVPLEEFLALHRELAASIWLDKGRGIVGGCRRVLRLDRLPRGHLGEAEAGGRGGTRVDARGHVGRGPGAVGGVRVHGKLCGSAVELHCAHVPVPVEMVGICEVGGRSRGTHVASDHGWARSVAPDGLHVGLDPRVLGAQVHGSVAPRPGRLGAMFGPWRVEPLAVVCHGDVVGAPRDHVLYIHVESAHCFSFVQLRLSREDALELRLCRLASPQRCLLVAR